jgi:hypothetical protein
MTGWFVDIGCCVGVGGCDGVGVGACDGVGVGACVGVGSDVVGICLVPMITSLCVTLRTSVNKERKKENRIYPWER